MRIEIKTIFPIFSSVKSSIKRIKFHPKMKCMYLLKKWHWPFPCKAYENMFQAVSITPPWKGF